MCKKWAEMTYISYGPFVENVEYLYPDGPQSKSEGQGVGDIVGQGQGNIFANFQ